MTDHLAKITREGRISCALALELLERLFAFDACLLELLLARLGRRGRAWRCLDGRLLSLGLRLRLLLGCLGPHLALSGRLSCRCLSCHFPSRLPVAPARCGTPSPWLNTVGSQTLPSSRAFRSTRNQMHASCRNRVLGARSPWIRRFVLGSTGSIWVLETA